MSKRYPRAKWVLPETVNPVRKCIQVPVPDDPFHIAAFRGALLTLASALSWQDDLAHTAKLAADVWRDIVANLDFGCGMIANLRINNCLLEAQFGDDPTWVLIGSFSPCARTEALDVIQQMIDDNLLSGGQQQGPIPRPPILICQTFNVTLNANNKWLCPVPLYAGDSVEVKQISGGWWDGGEVNWRCPDGRKFVLGECNGNPEVFGGDPAMGVGHMRIVGYDGSVWRDMYLVKYTPVNTIPQFILQSNDSNIDNNKGAVNLIVEVCTNQYLGDCSTAQAYWSWLQTDYCYTGNAPVSDVFHLTGIGGSVQFNPPPQPGFPRAIVLDLREANGFWPNKSGPWQVKLSCSTDLRLYAEEIRTGPCDRLDKVPIHVDSPIDSGTWYDIPANKPLLLIQSGSDGQGQLNSLCVK